MTEMTPRELASKIKKLKAKPLAAARYERKLVAREIWSANGVWYTSIEGRCDSDLLRRATTRRRLTSPRPSTIGGLGEPTIPNESRMWYKLAAMSGDADAPDPTESGWTE